MQQIRGTVVHVDAPYMGKREKTLWGIVGKLALIIAMVPIVVPLWLLGLMFGGRGSRYGFLSQVGVRVTSFWVSMRLFGNSGDITVRDFRVRDAAGRQRLVRVYGALRSGSLNIGDLVTVEGRDRNGTLVFQRGQNHTIQSALLLRP